MEKIKIERFIENSWICPKCNHNNYTYGGIALYESVWCDDCDEEYEVSEIINKD